MEPRIAAIGMAGLALWVSPPLPAEEVSRTHALQTLLGVPADMAFIKGAYLPRGQNHLHYILIEDAHESSEAQGKIAAILLYGHQHWGSRQAFVEGAFGPIGPPPFPIFTPERGDRGALELLQDGLFSAGELAAALSSQLKEDRASAFLVTGMDDPMLYRAQLEALAALVSLRSAALRDLNRDVVTWTPSEREILRRLINLQMTPSAFQRVHHSRKLGPLTPALARAISQAETYYHLADLRSVVFASAARRRIGNGPCLLVAGGYHMPAMARILRRRGESFVVLSPRLTQHGDHQLYMRGLAQTLQRFRELRYGSPAASRANILRLSLARQVN